MFRVLDLFSGIGGFSLGLERTGGFKTVAFCEIEPFCRRVLKKHWPDVPIYEDVRELTAVRLRDDGINPNVICGGFPCQDISFAGKGAGIDGERSGLWREFARLIGEIRPQYVIVENVSALLGRGLSRVLGDLAALGYDAEWHCISAANIGAPHIRDRVWIVADSRQKHCMVELSEHGAGASEQGAKEQTWVTKFKNGNKSRLGRADFDAWWANQPFVCGMANDVPGRLDRLGALGNAVVPGIPEIIGRAILESAK